MEMKRARTIATTKPTLNCSSSTVSTKHVRFKNISIRHTFAVATGLTILYYSVFNRNSIYYNFSINNKQYSIVTMKGNDERNNTTSSVKGKSTDNASVTEENGYQMNTRCAILFWGLPRAFESLVLPSIEENIILPNQRYDCDYFVHYYHQTIETSGRSGSGGTINPEAILELKTVIEHHAGTTTNIRTASATVPSRNQSRVEFTLDTEEQFWDKYTPLIEKIRNTKDSDGKYLYFPWKARTYVHPTTTDNIIKMWHSIESSWNLMESTRLSSSISYSQIAMLRSDVFYVNPIDIFYNPISSNASSVENSIDTKYAVIPDFGNYPVSDRIVYGSYDAVKIWASERFSRLDEHVKFIYENDKGWGLHSEKFLNYTIFPAIRQLGYAIVQHPTMCFFRARADETIWISDCTGAKHISDPRIMKSLGGSFTSIQTIIERILQRTCLNMTKAKRNVRVLHCPKRY